MEVWVGHAGMRYDGHMTTNRKGNMIAYAVLEPMRMHGSKNVLLPAVVLTGSKV